MGKASMVGLQVSPAIVIVPASLVSVLVIAAGLMFVRLTSERCPGLSIYGSSITSTKR
jgi:hypothetical protein